MVLLDTGTPRTSRETTVPDIRTYRFSLLKPRAEGEAMEQHLAN